MISQTAAESADGGRGEGSRRRDCPPCRDGRRSRERRSPEHRAEPITIHDIPDVAGNCSTVFNAVAISGILVDMIVQNQSGPGKAELSFTIPARRPHAGSEAARRTWFAALIRAAGRG